MRPREIDQNRPLDVKFNQVDIERLEGYDAKDFLRQQKEILD